MDPDLQAMYFDIMASVQAIANALDRRGVLTKAEIAEAAQERLLDLQAREPQEITLRLYLLRQLATRLERSYSDLDPGRGRENP